MIPFVTPIENNVKVAAEIFHFLLRLFDNIINPLLVLGGRVFRAMRPFPQDGGEHRLLLGRTVH